MSVDRQDLTPLPDLLHDQPRGGPVREHRPVFLLDSTRPRTPLADHTDRELRFRQLHRTDPVEAARLAVLAQEAVDQRWQVYEEMTTRGPERFPADARPVAAVREIDDPDRR